MPFSLRRHSDSGTFGLDIDGRYLAAAQVRDGRLASVASAELPTGLLSDGEVADRGRLTEALKDFVAANKLPRHVRLGIANQQILVRMIDLPRIDEPVERDAALRFQAAESIAMPLDEAVLDHQIAGYSAGEAGERMQVVAVAARRSMVEEYVAAARDAGLRPDGLDLDAFALIRTLGPAVQTAPPSLDAIDGSNPAIAVAPADPETARVFCHLGGVSNLAIARGESCFFARTLSAHFDDEGAGARLADEIRMSIDYYMGQPGALGVGDVVLSGEGAHDDEIVDDVRAGLAIPVESAAPLGALGAEAVPDGDDPYRYTVAAGLALGAAG